jgi:glycosyltransferase involved in cell wall biosynthesis
MTKKLFITIVVPFFNEESGVGIFYRALNEELLKKPSYEFEIVCIDDGSSDKTLELLVNLSKTDSRVRVIEFSRNFGKEAALSAGLDLALGDAVIPMDSDLQDPPSLVSKLIDTWITSNPDVVLARRIDRSSDTLPKRLSASLFYDAHNWVSQIKLPANVGDCRLMSRQVVEALKLLPEKQRFMKGLFAWVGFKTITINYVRDKRHEGNSKFSFWKLWNFALEGFTSFSTWPLRVWTYLGMLGALISMSYGLFIVFRTLINGNDVPGYTSILVSILFFGSLQLIGLGVLGEYVGRIYMESKRRPTYLIRKIH